MSTLDRHDSVFVLDLGDTENRFHPDWLTAVSALLDEVEKGDDPRALVTAASGKIWSNGLDLEWLFEHPEQFPAYTGQVHALFARVLRLPMVTVAALQGHAFAAGAMLSLCHDLRIMRADRGYWCLPEVDLGLPFTPGMNALLVAKLPKRTAHESMTTARRYTAPEAEAAGILDATAEESAVANTAIERAAALVGKAGPALGEIKTRLYADALAALRS